MYVLHVIEEKIFLVFECSWYWIAVQIPCSNQSCRAGSKGLLVLQLGTKAARKLSIVWGYGIALFWNLIVLELVVGFYCRTGGETKEAAGVTRSSCSPTHNMITVLVEQHFYEGYGTCVFRLLRAWPTEHCKPSDTQQNGCKLFIYSPLYYKASINTSYFFIRHSISNYPSTLSLGEFL